MMIFILDFSNKGYNIQVLMKLLTGMYPQWLYFDNLDIPKKSN